MGQGRHEALRKAPPQVAILVGRPWRGAICGMLSGGGGKRDGDSRARRRARQESPNAQPAGSVAKHPEEGMSWLLGCTGSANSNVFRGARDGG